MSFRLRRSLGNPLIRRVQRHASLATLYRSAVSYDQPAAPRPVVPAIYPDLVVGATLAPAGPEAVVPAEGAEVVEGGPQPSQEPVEPVRLVQPAQQGSAIPASATPPLVQRSAAPAAGVQPAPEKPPEEEDKVWRRLQAIFRRHQEKQAAEQQTAQEATQASPGEGKAVEAGERPASKPSVGLAPQEASPTKPGPRPLPAQKAAVLRRAEVVEWHAGQLPPAEIAGAPQPGGETEQPVEPSQAASPAPERPAAEEEPRPPSSGETTVMRKAVEKPEEAVNVDATQVLQPVEQPPLPGLAQPEVAEQAKPTAQAPAEPVRAVQRAREEIPSPAPSQQVSETKPLRVEAEDLLAPSPASPETEEPEAGEVQPVPLESVWPVQKLEAPETPAAPRPGATPSEAEPETQVSKPGEGQVPQAPTPERGPQVGHLLKEVVPGQPTESSVELILPHRPRPEVPAPSQPVKPGLTAEEPELLETELPLRPQETPRTKAPDQTVETEIGPLPADLWRLIGQKPPRPSTEAGPSAPIAMPAPSLAEEEEMAPVRLTPSSETAPVQRKPAPEEPIEPTESAPGKERQPETARLVTTQPPTVQPAVSRAVIIEDFEVTPGGAEEGTSQPGPGAAGRGSEVDVDELAARVYSEVKRRLTVEWERLRRKF